MTIKGAIENRASRLKEKKKGGETGSIYRGNDWIKRDGWNARRY